MRQLTKRIDSIKTTSDVKHSLYEYVKQELLVNIYPPFKLQEGKSRKLESTNDKVRLLWLYACKSAIPKHTDL